MHALLRFYAALLLLLQQIGAWFVVQRTRYQPGQGLVEYGLVLILVMVVCVAIVGLTGKTISRVWYEKLITPAFGT